MAGTLQRTPLHKIHLALGARMIPFAGWEMPVQYTSTLKEARAVRSHAGVFDVSHMGRIRLEGGQATGLLEWVATNAVASLKAGRARYTCLCNEEGGIIDDAIYYRLGEEEYTLVCNAANREHVLSWLKRWVEERYCDVALEDRTAETAMIALQGPEAVALLDGLCADNVAELRPFNWASMNVAGVSVFAARTGYTGEDGFEFILAGRDAPRLWQPLIDRGVTPCGLGARDVLRLEASYMLHGNDIDTTTTPIEAGMERFVHLDKEFAGVEALHRQVEAGVKRHLVGLRVRGRQIARKGYPILAGGREAGEVTSGTLSPTLDSSIALGYVSVEFAHPGQALAVSMRGRPVDAEVVSLPFYSRKR